MTSGKKPKSNPIGRSNRATTPQRSGTAKTRAAHLSKRAPRGKAAEPARSARKGNKQQVCFDLLCRAEGASVEELRQVTGWQAHSVRGFLSGAVKRKLGMALVSEKAEGQPRRYHIPRANA